VSVTLPEELSAQVQELARLVAASFPVEDILFEGERPAFVIRRPPDVRSAFAALRRRLQPMRLVPALRRRRGRDVVILLPEPPPLRTRWGVNLLLLLATLGTTFYAGYQQATFLVREGLMGDATSAALAFSLPLMAILLTHEMGHKVASMLRGIRASLPYFIPMPPLPTVLPIGTLGAVILTRSPAPDRNGLMDLGASGPLAGFLVAIPVLVYGIKHSFVLQALSGPLVSIPDPLLVQWLSRVLLDAPEGSIILGHPTYWAGWIGLLVTSLNLLPASMLDGGHAVRAALGPERHRVISYVAVAVALALGYVPMAILILFFNSRGHPGPLDDLTPLAPSRVLMGWLLVGIFVVSAVPLWAVRPVP
jgi:membrane-associated protease RseP (regulator of RpoE activity)